MKKSSKLVKEIDEATWRKFVAYCIIKNVKVGDELTKILKNFLEGKIK
ncbi:hypothetical protein ACFLZX_06000 [Nanoarchaeota archaeon]